MVDISIGQTSKGINIDKNDSKKSDFASLKEEYIAFKKKIAKSDMSNSKVIKEKELDFLQKLSLLARKESLSQEQIWIDEKISEIINMLSSETTAVKSAYYFPLSFKGVSSIKDNQVSENKINIAKILESYTNEDGQVDENAKKIVMAFDSSIANDYSLTYLLKKCCDSEGIISEDVANAVEILAKSSVNPVIIPQVIETMTHKDPEGKPILDLSIFHKFSELKKADFDDFDAFKLIQFLSSNFEDKAKIESQILKMKKAGISSDLIIGILQALSVNKPGQSRKNISDSAINSVLVLKKTLASTRNNEKSERENPINKLGVITINLGNDVMIMKGNKVTYISHIEGKSVHSLKKEYDELLSKIEDNLLLEYVKKYKDDNGELDSKYLRVMTILRNKGITYEQLINMTDFCVDKNGINTDKLNSIIKIKAAGALDIDILPILSSIAINTDDSYNQEDIENACELSSAVIGGNEVITLLPEVRGNKDLKEFFVYFSQFIEDKSNLVKILSLIKDEKGNIDENAIDILYNLADNFLTTASSHADEVKFMDYARDIVYSARNKDDINVSDEGAKICSLMCVNGNSPEEILMLLEKCKDSMCKIDKKLAEISCRFIVENTQLSDIESAIDFCKKSTGKTDYMRSDSIISLFEKGYSKDEIISYINKL